MAEIAASFVGPAIEFVKWIGAPIMRRFNYLCCFTSNITTLKLEAEKLDAAEGDLQGKVDRARDNVEIIAHEVEAWLTKSNDIKGLKNTILDEVPNVESGCLKLRARFSLSKRAKKTTDRIIELRGQCKFDAISQPRPPAAAEAIPLGMTTYEFKSRKQIEEDIMTSLRDGDVNMIGISGMGGLGKTTMAKIIKNRALKEYLFDEVVMAVVSQQPDNSKIQLEIGGSLGLDLKDETAEASRVQKLHARLTEGKKRILVVLDDVWQRLVFEDLGIPRGYKGCTILLTSRNSDVLRAMDVQKDFGMKVLSEEDAWLLFRGRAGTCVDNTGLNSAAKEVVEECRGLPIALTTVGSALKDENDKCIWKDAVTQLRKASPNNISDFIKEVYNPLRVSYDKLESQQAKSVFLLCCLFGEDANIPLNYLTYFCMGLGIFEGGISNLEEARNRMSALIKRLKSRSLLLDGWNQDYVRMHDVVRDVCIFIAKEKGYISGNDCTWISSFQTTAGERIKLPINLRLLFLSHNYSKQEEEINKFNDCYVEGIRDLQVLFIENYSSLTSLPHTTESLRNLKTLVLNSCPKLETISFVGELVHLEILICRGCDLIKELPREMKQLNRLKLLDLTWCTNLERICRGIISSLVGLEELKMLRSFKKWEAARDSNGRENGNAMVRELEALTNLRCLEIEIDDPALAVQNMRLSSKLDRFRIRIGSEGYHEFLPDSFNKAMSLKWEGETCVGEWIEILIRDAECLQLTGNGANNVDYMAKSQNIRRLKLGKCENMKNIGITSMDDATVFPFIERLSLLFLPQLEEIFDCPISSNSFQNLKELKLEDLPALKKLWKNSGSSRVFHNLSSISIVNCPKLEEILDGPISSNSFQNLKELQLRNLPALKQLWKSSSSPVFHNLSSISISNCPKLEEILDGPIWSNSFHNLKELNLQDFPALKQLWKSSSSPVFHNLSSIRIVNCPKLEDILDGPISSNSFHNLKALSLKNLPALKQLWKSSSSPVFHNLSSISIYNCPKLEEILDGPISSNSFHNLKFLNLFDLPALKQLWKSSSSPVFHNLFSIWIVNCPKLEEILDGPISSNSFHNLKELQLQRLPALKQLWKSSNSSPVFHNLSSISISNCPKFEEILDGPISSNSFHNLSSISIVNCPCLRNLGQLSSIAENNCLSQLRFLSVKDCEMMEQVFLWNEEDERRITKIVFPKLEEVKLDNLPNLVNLCQGIGGIEFPLLNKMRMDNLPNLVTLCQGIGSIEFPLLTYMWIEECPKMKSLVSSEENNCGGSTNADIDDYHSPYLFCQQEKVSFDSLKILAVEGNAFYCQKIPVSFFNGLEELTVCGYKGSMSLFTSLIAQNFVNLRGLIIRNCYEIVKVIKDEEAVSGGERPLLFPKLDMLELTDLCKLESFCEWNCDVNCRIMKIDGCSNYMIKIFNLGSNVSFSFHGLEVLTISNYEGGMSLFSSSMAANILVSLRKLEIYDCKEMVKVIEDEKEEENVVSSGGAQTTTTILFPKLQELKLKWLWKLESFCEWKCDIELPSLRKVAINRCFNMKIFSRGLITPNLESVEIDRNKVLESGEKDLNGALELIYKKEQQRVRLASINSMIEFSSLFATDEDEETKSEIEEEQNWKTTNPAIEEEEGRKGEIEEEQNS